MQYSRRIEPPLLEGARPRGSSLRELDDEWDDIEPTSRRAMSRLALFPPGRTDAEIEAIVDEFTQELCGLSYY